MNFNFSHKKTFLIVFIFSVFNLFLSKGIAADKINVAYIEFPPVFSTNSNNQAEGFLIDLTKAVMKKIGYEPEFASFPTKRMISNIVSGESVLWVGAAAIPDFKDNTYVGDNVVAKIDLRAYTIGKKDPVTKKEDLNGKSVIIMDGYGYGGWVDYIKDPKNGVKIEKTNSHESALKMLQSGRGDYLLDYKQAVESTLKVLTIKNIEFNDVSSIEAKFVVSKKFPKAEELLKKLEAAYIELKKEGKL